MFIKTFGGSKDIWLWGQFNMFHSVSRLFLHRSGVWPNVLDQLSVDQPSFDQTSVYCIYTGWVL